MKRRAIRVLVLLGLMGLTIGVANAVDYSFTGEVFNTLGDPVEDEAVDIRYVYHFEGVVPHEGRSTVATSEAGFFTLACDITNIWGDGDMLYVEAWATCRDQEEYIAAAYPGTENFIGHFVVQHTKPGDPGTRFSDIGKSGIEAEPAAWGAVKACFK